MVQTPVHTCGPDDDVHVALATMKQHRVRRLPVEGFGGTVMGMVSMNDILLAAGARKPVRDAEVVDTFQADLRPSSALAAHCSRLVPPARLPIVTDPAPGSVAVAVPATYAVAARSHLLRALTDGAHGFLQVHDRHHRLEQRIGIQREAVDPLGHEKPRELRVIAGRLAADADLPAGCVCRANHLGDRPLDGVIALVEQVRDELRVAVDAEHELREIVAADGEAVEHLRELLRQDHVAGDLAHHVDLETALAAAPVR